MRLRPSVLTPNRIRTYGAVVAGLAILTATGCGPSDSRDDGATYSVTVTTPDDGEVRLTKEPKRIAALNGNRVVPFLVPFLNDDHRLVGYGNDIDPADYPWIEDVLKGVPNSPDADGPSPETYLSWKPDLMIANGNLGDYWAPAAKVGPLVQLPETDWRATTTLLGEIFEEPDIADKVIADTDGLIADARLDEPVTAAVLSPYQENGTVGTQVLGAELPNFLADLNIQVAGSDTAEDGYEDVSLEVLGERLKGVDHVILFNNGDELRDSFLANPLVAEIPVIKAGNVTRLTTVQSGAGFPVNPLTVPVLIEALQTILSP